ncbi:MAG: GGDEF domain-containing protein [Blastocatellia bacterium]|nr:GGDEF domain-containing protein [Blastocatellia bacterium]
MKKAPVWVTVLVVLVVAYLIWLTPLLSSAPGTRSTQLPLLVSRVREVVLLNHPDDLRKISQSLATNDPAAPNLADLRKKIDDYLVATEGERKRQAKSLLECTDQTLAGLFAESGHIRAERQQQLRLALYSAAGLLLVLGVTLAGLVGVHTRLQNRSAFLTSEMLRLGERVEGFRRKYREMFFLRFNLEAQLLALQDEVVELRTQLGKDELTQALKPLTGIIKTQQLIQQCLGRKPLWVAIFDIDFFKRVNDDYSYESGNTAIKILAAIIRENLGEHDFLIRFGGEEFVAVFPEASLSEVQARIGKIQNAVRGVEVKDLKKDGALAVVQSQLRAGSSITVSGGFVEMGESDHYHAAVAALRSFDQNEIAEGQGLLWDKIANLEKSIRLLANARLSEAKQTGRDKIVGPRGLIL